MSISHLNDAWEAEGLTTGEKFVLVALACRANDRGECWPAVADLAQRTSMTERGVRNALRSLENAGLIICEIGRGGRYKTNRYTLKTRNTFPGIDPVNPEVSSGYQQEKAEVSSGFNGRNPEVSSQNPELSSINPEVSSGEPTLTINQSSSRAGARAGSGEVESEVDGSFFMAVIKAAGVREDRLPSHWMPPAGELHVARWKSQGLSEPEILSAIRESRKRHAEAPTSPRAFDRAMNALVEAKKPGATKPESGGIPKPYDFDKARELERRRQARAEAAQTIAG